MPSLTFTVPDETADGLSAAARERGVRVEDLLQTIALDFLARSDEFQSAADYVFRKNAELYRRLAK
jgi:hypothetical protein